MNYDDEYVWYTGYAKSPQDPNSIADLDGDGDVDEDDYTLLFTMETYQYQGELDSLVLNPYLESMRGQGAGGLVPLATSVCDVAHQGLFFDKEFGCYHNRGRTYHPTLARFLQRDPVEYKDGMSLYEYVRSNPLVTVDPYGREGRTSNQVVQHYIAMQGAPCRALHNWATAETIETRVVQDVLTQVRKDPRAVVALGGTEAIAVVRVWVKQQVHEIETNARAMGSIRAAFREGGIDSAALQIHKEICSRDPVSAPMWRSVDRIASTGRYTVEDTKDLSDTAFNIVVILVVARFLGEAAETPEPTPESPRMAEPPPLPEGGPPGTAATPKYGATPKGRPFTKHYGIKTGPQRNIPGSVVDSIIDTTEGVSVEGGKIVHYDPVNDVTVVTGDGDSIVSVHKGKP